MDELSEVPDAVIRGTSAGAAPPDAADAPSDTPAVEPHEFSDFYKTQKPRLIGFLMAIGADWYSANDIAQESMVEIWRRWGGIRKPHAYVRVVATKGWLRVVSKPTHNEGSLNEYENDDPDQALADPLDLVIRSAEHRGVLARIRRLPPRQRQVIAWTYDGYEPKEIAEILKIPPNTVSASLLKARKALQRMREEDSR